MIPRRALALVLPVVLLAAVPASRAADIPVPSLAPTTTDAGTNGPGPDADFTTDCADPSGTTHRAAVGVPTDFVDLSRPGDAAIVSWSWDLDGDGDLDDSTLQHPRSTYATSGTVAVTLRVTDALAQTSTVTKTVQVDWGTKGFTATAKIYADDPAANDAFGTGVALQGDRMLVGAPLDADGQISSGSTYHFEYDGTDWVQIGKLRPNDAQDNDRFGTSVAVDGDRAVVGAAEDDDPSNSGSAYVFEHDGTDWVQTAKLRASDRSSSDNFGQSVALVGDRLLVGAYQDDGPANSGSVYVFEYAGGTWNEITKLRAGDAASSDNFGAGSAMYGPRALIGATGDDDGASSAGSAYVFDHDGTGFTQSAKILASDPTTNDLFGRSVSLHGNLAVIGSIQDDVGQISNAGSVYRFVFDGTNWVEQSKLVADDAAANDNLGTGSAVWGGVIAGGSPFDDDNATSNSGSVYIYNCGVEVPPGFEVSGRVFEDVDGDLLAGVQTIGDAANPGSPGVTVSLYTDGGDGVPDGTDDTFRTTTTTDASGAFTFAVVPSGTHWVVVDSRTVAPSAGLNPGFTQDDVWAEQTYGPVGAVTFDGSTYAYAATAGAVYGGQRAGRSDDASALGTAELVVRVAVGGAPVTGIDLGFSFQVVTSTRDGDDDPASARTVQGSLRAFIQNSNAIAGTQTAVFELGGPQTIAPTSALPTVTDPVVLDATGEDVVLSGVSAGAASGLVLDTDDSVVRGLTITGFSGDGIALDGSGNAVLENTITSNGGDGVSVASGSGNTILGNSIRDNGGLGIDLGGDGVTANDGGDADAGANELLNTLEITDADISAGNATVTYTLDLPPGVYRIEFFTSDTVDASGYGEGATLVYSQTITHTGAGPLTFSTGAFAASPSDRISATVTQDLGAGSYGSTSEFSAVWVIGSVAAPVGVVLFAPTTTTAVSAGDRQSCVRRSDGTLRCWGDNASGQLGDGSSDPAPLPVAVSALTHTKGIAPSSATSHNCAVTASGRAWCWGDGSDGRLGWGSSSSATVPVQVAGVTGFVSVATGGAHSCGVRSDGTVWCWGSDSRGQLGDGGLAADSDVPVQVSGLTGAVEVSLGSEHSCARRSDGSVLCWGSDQDGQLGGGAPQTDSQVPVAVASLDGVRTITAGSHHACAVRTDGTAWCWGRNDDGQLGDGTTTDLASPVQISGATDVLTAGAGADHTCLSGGDGEVRCVGGNADGQLGDGTTTPSLALVGATGLHRVKRIDAGAGHTCAVDGLGRAWCWGAGADGQLGDGPSTSRTAPTLVAFV